MLQMTNISSPCIIILMGFTTTNNKNILYGLCSGL